MYFSAEVRWFRRGPVPREVRRWLDTGALGRHETPRTDVYLVLPGCRVTGIKVRQGRLEVKSLVESLGERGFIDGVTGVRETWVKWSAPAPVADPSSYVTGDDEAWVSVTKMRFLRRLAMGSGEIREVDAGGEPLCPGCHIELTALKYGPWRPDTRSAHQDDWWTLSLEAFGEPSEVPGVLDRGAELLFQRPPPMTLDAACSLSYPAWLAERRECRE